MDHVQCPNQMPPSMIKIDDLKLHPLMVLLFSGTLGLLFLFLVLVESLLDEGVGAYFDLRTQRGLEIDRLHQRAHFEV